MQTTHHVKSEYKVKINFFSYDKQKQKDEYKMFAGFGGTPNISQIRRPWGRLAMGPDYF